MVQEQAMTDRSAGALHVLDIQYSYVTTRATIDSSSSSTVPVLEVCISIVDSKSPRDQDVIHMLQGRHVSVECNVALKDGPACVLGLVGLLGAYLGVWSCPRPSGH